MWRRACWAVLGILILSSAHVIIRHLASERTHDTPTVVAQSDSKDQIVTVQGNAVIVCGKTGPIAVIKMPDIMRISAALYLLPCAFYVLYKRRINPLSPSLSHALGAWTLAMCLTMVILVVLKHASL